jgi:hypothetical protein
MAGLRAKFTVYFLCYITKERNEKFTKLAQTQTILPVHIAGAELHLYSLSNGMGIYLDLVKSPAFVYTSLKQC